MDSDIYIFLYSVMWCHALHRHFCSAPLDVSLAILKLQHHFPLASQAARVILACSRNQNNDLINFTLKWDDSKCLMKIFQLLHSSCAEHMYQPIPPVIRNMALLLLWSTHCVPRCKDYLLCFNSWCFSLTSCRQARAAGSLRSSLW